MPPYDRTIIARAQRNDSWLTVDLYFYSEVQGPEGSDRQRHVATNAVFEPVAAYAASEPLIRLEQNMAQRLADDLWDQGIRPTEARSRSDEVHALKDHIADLQKLIFETQDERIPKAVLEPLLKFATSAADRVLTPEGPSLDPR